MNGYLLCLLQLMANIFQQLGGQGQMPGLMPGDGAGDAGGASSCMYSATSLIGV